MSTTTLAALSGLTSDPTGSVTFQRFLWQAKISVLHWLVTLAPGGPLAVVCEHVEDLVVVEEDVICFAQLKTRDKGSWSAAKICQSGHAVNALVKSYLAARTAGIHSVSRFEVWLEGPQSEERDTVIFFADPRRAPDGIKKKIREMGLKGSQLSDFLGRLVIRCQRPSRESIDAVVMREIGASWPHLSYSEIESLYERLLSAATAAQASSEQPPTVRAAIQAARLHPEDDRHWLTIKPQALTRGQLRVLCPPLNLETNERLFERAAKGEASLLELKMRRAGARQNTIDAAIAARADAEVAATLNETATTDNQVGSTALDRRILAMANSIIALGEVNNVISSRPAEYAFHSLMSRPSDVNAMDADEIYNGDHRLVVGHLCRLSDLCLFGWGL